MARPALALAPEGLIDRQGDEALFGQLLRIQVRALLLHRTHRMADDDRRMLGIAIEVLGSEQIADDFHIVLVVERDLLRGHSIAFIEVVGAIGHVWDRRLVRSKRCAASDGQDTQRSHAGSSRLQEFATIRFLFGHIESPFMVKYAERASDGLPAIDDDVGAD